MRLSTFSKTRIAAMSISASSNLSIIDIMIDLDVIEKELEDQSDDEKKRIGELLWNELSTIGLKLRTRDKIARCFELACDIKVVPLSFKSYSIGSFLFREKFANAAIIPTQNTNGHSYTVGKVCITNSCGARSGCLRQYGDKGNSIDASRLAFPNYDKLLSFFATQKVGVVLPIKSIVNHYGKDTIYSKFEDIDKCKDVLMEYKNITSRIMKVNELANSSIVRIL